MKTVLLLVDDAYAESLRETLPPDKAWILDERYDRFRCEVHHALRSYEEDASDCMLLEACIDRTHSWLEAQQ